MFSVDSLLCLRCYRCKISFENYGGCSIMKYLWWKLSHDLSRTGNKSSRLGGREHSREMTLTSGKEWTKMYKKGVRLVTRQFENEMKTAAVNYWERKSRKKTNLHKDRCLKTQ